MIFVTLGSQKFQFNRLLSAIDILIERGVIFDDVFAQIGHSNYKPRNYKFIQFLDRDRFIEMELRADIVITHGGTGAIVGAIKSGKKVIAVPRLAKYGEHVDDHQIQLIAQFREQNLICGLNDCSELEAGLKYVSGHTFDAYESKTEAIINSIDRYLQKIGLEKVLDR